MILGSRYTTHTMTKFNYEKYDIHKYYKRCKVIENLVRKEYPNLNYKFVTNPDNHYVEIIIEKISQLTILEDNTWAEVKRHIDKKIIAISQKGNWGDCIICFEKIKINVSCPKCANSYCFKCYINLFKTGKGIITCPSCRYSVGEELPKFFLQLGIDELQERMNIINRTDFP
jgi:hypothetical protein